MGIKTVAAGAAVALLAALLNAAAILPAMAQSAGGPGMTSRLIIKFRSTGAMETNGQRQAQAATGGLYPSQRDRAHRLAESTGLTVRASRDLGRGMVALGLGRPLAGDELDEALKALRANPDIEFAEVDQRRYPRAIPSDPLYSSQWYLQGTEASATNFEAAWDSTTGSADTVLAVLDTGIRSEHPDLAGRVLPGYDFVSPDATNNFATANDGNGRDADASDPGDWLTSADLQSPAFADCSVIEPEPSSWHGTRVAAMAGAATNEGVGMAGGTWSGRLLPVRVLGKCGGYDSDIVDGMRWAAGLTVAGAPANPNPAQIINMSLGSTGSCTSVYRNAITELTDAGVLIVVAAGNETGPVEAPANCAGVLAVNGLRHVGTKVGYSSFGPEVGVAAPAGNCPSTPLLCEYSLITATNAGVTGPTTSTYRDTTDDFSNIGTSFSAPIVAATAALMHAVNDRLTPEEYIARIKASARPFPAPDPGLPSCPSLGIGGQCNCTTTTCGAGIADAPGAVAEALRPMARIVRPDGSGAGQNVALNGSSSAAARNRTISAYAWTGVSGNPAFVGAVNGPVATVAVPPSGQVTVRLTVTDDMGRIDSHDETLGAAPSSGGGGAVDLLTLLALCLLWRRPHRQRC